MHRARFERLSLSRARSDWVATRTSTALVTLNLSAVPFCTQQSRTDKTVNLSENEQEREVLDGFVGSAAAGGAKGHAGSFGANAVSRRFCTTKAVRTYELSVTTRGCKHQRNAARLWDYLTGTVAVEKAGGKLQRIKNTLQYAAAERPFNFCICGHFPVGIVYIYSHILLLIRVSLS